ncbi:rhodanese-like domain-containing protein [Sulfuriroseicoccus oceanibius]|uniref:Rhodanese-like domain-containing protein n=1 Tax=Sulfuriroseicoccus oceanibius TaxID=2707525 RepID=A0A6B3LB30_9BACT|nr:rhodanese-like domain-containing protein [Sulfuriroseicoccus oceanibius]QQL46224.1 rhodanese-like domain-containing protein [Sulfuriroseicoccus oceanibius]
MYRFFIQVLIVTVLIGVASLVVKAVHPDGSTLDVGITEADLRDGEILVEEALKKAEENGVLWVDLRPRAEYADEHIDGAINVSVLEGDNLSQELFNLEMSGGVELDSTSVILYCASTECDESHRVLEELRELNLPIKTHVLAGGWPEYKRVMRTLEK